MRIITKDLGQTYFSGDRSLPVLRDITVTIEAGEIVAFVGPSGSGKTTLLGLLAGLDRPASGSVSLEIGPRAAAFHSTAATWPSSRTISGPSSVRAISASSSRASTCCQP